MNILALDLGKFNTTCCVFDSKTRKTRFLTTPTQRESLVAMQELKAVHMPSQEHREFRSLVKACQSPFAPLRFAAREPPTNAAQALAPTGTVYHVTKEVSKKCG